MSDQVIRQGVIETARALNQRGLSTGTSGNVSARTIDGCLITPSGTAYDDLGPDDIVALDRDGKVLSGSLAPSSEWRFHVAIYLAHADAGAIVHCHSLNATALACHGIGIPAFHYMVAAIGGKDVRCAPYATFGTEALSDNAVAAMEERRACLLANHGQIATGPTLGEALSTAEALEELAAQYLLARQLGEPDLLEDAEMERVLGKFADYGRGSDSD